MLSNSSGDLTCAPAEATIPAQPSLLSLDADVDAEGDSDNAQLVTQVNIPNDFHRLIPTSIESCANEVTFRPMETPKSRSKEIGAKVPRVAPVLRFLARSLLT